jgi:hypothetical protein
MHNGRWFNTSLSAGAVHSRFLHWTNQAHELKTRDAAEHSWDAALILLKRMSAGLHFRSSDAQ